MPEFNGATAPGVPARRVSVPRRPSEVVAARARTCHDRSVEPLLWVVLGVVLAVAEIFTTTLFLVMFAAGAFAAAAAAALDAPVSVQAIVFALVSALSVAVIRPVITRYRQEDDAGGGTPFGVQAIEGSEALVLEQVDADHGMVKIDGEMWSARAF